MDWETLSCPDYDCRGYGKPFAQGYLVKNGTSRGQPRAWCKACEASVVLSYGTAYYGLEAEPAIFETAVRALAEGNSLRATARIVQVDKDTVCAWLHRVACHCRTVLLSFWRDLHVSECQLDELWSFVHTKEAHLPGAKIYCDTDGDTWVWSAFAPVWRLVLAFVIGKRDQAGANLLLARVAHVTDDAMPFFTSDQLPAYRQALLHTYGEWYAPQRQGSRGAYPKPRRRPPPTLQYAQVVKRREGGRMVHVSTRVVFGTPEAVAARLAHSPVSSTVNTSFVERDNLTQRQSNRRLTRRTNGFSKDLTWFEKQLWLSLAYYHLVLPHQSLRERLPMPEPTRGTGSPRTWRPVTPAMAAGLTDHIWTTSELLAYRVPVAFLDQLPTIKHLFPE
ncbi:MAG: helix-turn-helix domain-containing protein [Candidatus Tectimicrobiota bacterium]